MDEQPPQSAVKSNVAAVKEIVLEIRFVIASFSGPQRVDEHCLVFFLLLHFEAEVSRN